MTRRSITILIVVAITVVVWLTFPRSHDPSPFKKAIDRHHQITIPPDGKATEPTITRTDWNATAEWKIETEMEWEEYKLWLAKRFGSRFRTIAEDEFQITLRRTDHAEIHDVTLRIDEISRRIHVRFSVSPW